ncbi:MAG: thiamine-phosphate kinase [Planctomycetota bacterium]|nr:thiamine-phosphate kinase [Planctomycetota bacterium]
MRESELLAHIYERSTGLPPVISVGPGDDAAEIVVEGGRALVTVDQLVEGRHYDPATTDVDLVARKAVGRSVSDIAAMGGRPTCAFATAALREGFADADRLFDRMAAWAKGWGCPLAGGDIATVDGPTVLTVTVMGTPHAGRGSVLRSGARVGDSVYVTGKVGGAFASGRHLMFEPRVREGSWLCDALGERLRAMIDVSDGVGRDAGRVAKMSGARIEIDAGALPLHEDAGDWREAVGAGEDYELLFCASGEVAERCAETGTVITKIGRVVEGEGCFVVAPDGARVDARELGWDHG